MHQKLQKMCRDQDPKQRNNLCKIGDKKEIKKALREYFLQVNKKYKMNNFIIRQRIIKLINIKKPTILGIYWPIQNEFNLLPIVEKWLKNHPRNSACLPVIDKNNLYLQFYPWEPGMQMENGQYGIPIPSKRNSETIKVPDLLLIPCISFDSNFFRLGYGGGYYDRTIRQIKQNHQNKLLTVGIASKHSKVNMLPREAHDQALDLVINDAKI